MRALLAFGLALAFACAPAQARGWCAAPLQAYDDSTDSPPVTLSGQVVERWAWGPPGFGEDPIHDRRWRPTFLRLDRRTRFDPLRYVGEDAKPALLTLREIQVRGALESDANQLRKVIGRHVIVTGPLWRSDIPADVGEIYLDGKSVRLSRQTICKPGVDEPTHGR